ncbi:LysR family transcriptional regulator [Burkholderia pyrrocinia]|nr:LysR family transcriptional regulator [Burkholderia pyrrocinia]
MPCKSRITSDRASLFFTDMKLLQDFLALAATGNFTRAAELRHVSQAAFSRRIQALESWAGVPLVERGSIPSRLTEAGQRLRVTTAETVAKLSRAKADLSVSAPEARAVPIRTR